MPSRKTPLLTNYIYHIVNRGHYSQPIFLNKWSRRRFIQTVEYYGYSPTPLGLADFLMLSARRKALCLRHKNVEGKNLVEIYAFCLMSNHFHFLLRQVRDGGIAQFMSLVQNSYTRYFNTKAEKRGSLFEGPFRSVLVETDEQLVHVSRYIHLNPYSSGIVSSLPELDTYPWSSWTNYLGEKAHPFVNTKNVLGLFSNAAEYHAFVRDQATFQRELEIVKHLALEQQEVPRSPI